MVAQDHPACLAAFKTREELGEVSVTDELLGAGGNVRPRTVLSYLLRRKGALTTTGCDHGAFVSTKGKACVQQHRPACHAQQRQQAKI